MKKTIVILLIMVLILACGSQVFAQSEAAVVFLLISPSIQANSMGGTYLNTAASDPMASIMNPAYLGFFAQQNTFGYSKSDADWLTELVPGLTYRCKSFTGGYTFKNLPVSIGFGYHQVKLDYGRTYLPTTNSPGIIGTYTAWEEAKIYSYSALLDSYCRLSIGVNFKSIGSHLIPGDFFDGNNEFIYGTKETSAHAMDWGMAVQIPVLKTLSQIFDHKFIDDTTPVIPVGDLGFSYAHSNIGNGIRYIDPDQANPLPRNARAGINLHLGMNYQDDKMNFQIISWKYAWESEGLLVKRIMNDDYSSEIKYLSTLWSVDSDKITHKTGWELSMFDFLYLRNGHYSDKPGQLVYDTYGWGINLVQFYRTILWLDGRSVKESSLAGILEHLDIEFHRSTYRTEPDHPLSGTEFNGITVSFSNIF